MLYKVITTGVQREMPTFGAIRHPGAWVEGMWLTPQTAPLMALTRMTADFNNPGGLEDVLVLGDHDSPEVLLGEILRKLGIDALNRIAVITSYSIHYTKLYDHHLFYSD